ncbi:MAG TPA: glycoside hydrolase family 2 TIM barrel-domain containing protein [Trebonia sp.]|nr:glycoside hydrolase family 2 TIM barrel-domain containing protein [Trebonia sp.]
MSLADAGPQPTAGLRPQTNTCRTAVDLSGLWMFRFDDRDSRAGIEDGVPIGVPGSWNDQLPGARDEFGPAWYERRFEAPRLAGREAAIRFGSVSYAAEVWLNGTWLGGHEGGHLPFALPCGDALADGENVLIVRVDGRLGRDRVPPGLVPPEHSHGRAFHPDVPFDFFPFAGIHRRPELVITPPDGIRDLRVDTVRDGDGAEFRVVAEAGGGEITLTLDGEPIGAAHHVDSTGLWSPQTPRLHLLAVELRRGGALVDRYTLRCGIRTVEVAGDELLLNGAPVHLRGFGRHEDFAVFGRGTHPALAARDLHLMREVGANSFRTAHYPCDEETLDVADQLGLMVIAETPAVALYFADEDFGRRQELSLRFVAEMIARDRNRACVIGWSVANEPRMNHPLAAGALRELCDAARALDGSRPVSYATDLPDAPGVEAADIVFLNSYPGWYRHPGQLDVAESVLADTLDRVHERYRKPVVLTEFGADAIPGTHADPPAMWTEEYQAELIERLLRVAAGRDFVAGTHVWAFADFATAQADHRPESVNFKGVFTRDRRPKLAARRLRELWAKPPFVRTT